MNILIITNFNHKNTGWGYLSNNFRQIIYEKYPYASIEIKNITYTSVWSSSFYFYTYKNIDLCEKYDLIIVCEGKPCKKWIKNGPIIWIPCQEFLSGGPWGFLTNSENNWYHLLSPSKYLYDKIEKKNPTLDTHHMQIWSYNEKIYNYKPNLHNKLNLFLHFKTRNWESYFWRDFLKELNNYLPDIDLTIKIDNNSDLDLRNINLNNVNSLIMGQIKDKDAYIEALCKSDVYITPRIMEGIGLCPQDAAGARNVIIGSDVSTYNEYFSKKNGLIIKCDEFYKNDSKKIMDEKKTIVISNDGKYRIINYLKRLNNNRDYLEKIKKYNQSYAKEKYHEFESNFTEYISDKINKHYIPVSKKRKIIHVQTCLEGGQGLISTLIASDLNKHGNCLNEFYYLSNNEYQKALDSYYSKLSFQGIETHHSISYNDINLSEADIVFFHWSSSARKRIKNYDSYVEWIKNVNIPTIGLIYDSIEVMPDICDYYCVASKFNTRFSPNLEKTFIVPYQVEDGFYNISRKENTCNYKYSSFVIGRISRLIERKFNSKFVPVCKYLNNKFSQVSFHILGDGNYRNHLESQFDSVGIPYKIEGGLYEENRIKVMNSFDLCLYLTGEHEESFCLAVAECMALGVPVVCENKGALSEVVEDGGYACDNFYEIVDKCEQIIGNLELRKQLSIKSKKKSLDYTGKNVTSKYMDIINEIV